MATESRREFLSASGKLLVGGMALATFTAHGSDHGKAHGTSAEGHAIDAKATDTCATCEYWGGMRKVAEDKNRVIAQSMGWCNNPNSMNYQKLTMADHRMQKTGIWKRWGVLGT